MAKVKDTGIRTFDGRLSITVGRKTYRLLNDPECALLIDADPTRKIVLLTKDSLLDCEVHIGYIQHVANRLFVDRGWQSRAREMFGIKYTHTQPTSTLFRYDEVLAWCYQDEE